MFSKVTLVSALALALGGVYAAPPAATRVGDATLFTPSGPGACGLSSTPTQFVAGVSPEIFQIFGGGNPNTNPVCGRFIIASTADGKSVVAKVVEECGNCATNDILLSQPAFSTLANPSAGVIHNVDWRFLPA